MSGRIERIAVAAGMLTVLLVVATSVLFTFDGVFGSEPLSNVLALLAVACYAVVGGLISSRLPRNACGWLLLLTGLGLVLSMCAEEVSTLALRNDRIVLASGALWVNSWLLVATVWPGIVLYLLVFPTGVPPSQRWRPFVVGVMALSIAGVLVRMVDPWEEERVLTNPLAVPGVASITGILFVAISLAFAVATVLVVVSVVRRFRRASSLERHALRWLAVVAVLSAAFLVIAIAAGVLGLDRIGDPFGVAFLLTLVVGLPLSAAVALLKRRLNGIEVVANRSIVYSSTAATITTIYAVIVAGVGSAVGRSDRTNVFAAVAATAVAAVVFQPVRRRAQVFADRLIYGARLFLSEKTVEAHVRGILTKLGLAPAPDENRRVLAVLAFLRST